MVVYVLNIVMAQKAGLCFGVKRAIEMAETAAAKEELICCGPLIHNRQEVERLGKLGVKTVEDDLTKAIHDVKPGEAVLIRSHGVGPEVFKLLENQGCHVINATCPFVDKAQKLAADAHDHGFQVIILGDKNHDEVRGLQAWTGGAAWIVASAQELEEISLPEKVAVLAQTTEKESKFTELVTYLQDRVNELKVLPTICQATRERQEAAAGLASKVDIMIVVGGKHSSNTRKLWEVSERRNPRSYMLEEAQDLKPEWFTHKKTVGITAGASTPDWIIKEVIDKMEELIKEEQNNAETEDQMDESMEFVSFRPGEILTGKIVKISSDEVWVDIGGKSEGIISAEELSYRKTDPRNMVKLGQDIMVEVLKEDREGNIILSHKRAMVEEALKKLEEAQKEGTVIEAPVVEVVKGGLVVDVGVRGFVPASQIDTKYIDDLSKYLHQQLRMKVIELDKNSRKAVLSQKVVLSEESKKQKEALWEGMQEGMTQKGVVKRIASFGAFVDIGGVDGLLHVSEMGWSRVNNPADVVAEGDEIEVEIIKIDRAKGKVSLSLKQLLKNPWDVAAEKYQVGMVVTGKVVRTVPFGAFIKLEPGVEGLAHISQLSQKRVNKVEDVLSVGQMVDAKITEIDMTKKRISLSLKDVITDAERKETENFLDNQENLPATIGDTVKENNPAKEDNE